MGEKGNVSMVLIGDDPMGKILHCKLKHLGAKMLWQFHIKGEPEWFTIPVRLK